MVNIDRLIILATMLGDETVRIALPGVYHPNIDEGDRESKYGYEALMQRTKEYAGGLEMNWN